MATIAFVHLSTVDVIMLLVPCSVYLYYQNDHNAQYTAVDVTRPYSVLLLY